MNQSSTSPDDIDRYRAPALDKGLDILELLAGTEEGLTQADIATHLKRSPSEFYRMLDRLVRRGYVTKIDSDRYCLTLKLFGLAQAYLPVRRLVSYATPLMRSLAARTRQSSQMSVFDRGRVVVIAQQEAPDYWGISIRVGAHIGLSDTGSGRVLLAFRSREEQKLMIAENARHQEELNITPELWDRLDQVKERGYEMMESAQMSGVYNLAAPILGPDGRSLAALTCPYIPLAGGLEGPDMASTIEYVCATAQQLSALTGADLAQRLEDTLNPVMRSRL